MHSLLNMYMLTTLVKWNSAYSISLGDLKTNKIPLFRLRLKVNTFCFTQKACFIRQAILGITKLLCAAPCALPS